MQRSILLIDGGNFYFKLKSLNFNNQLNFDFSAFATYLADTTTLVSCTYYVGEVRTDGTQRTQHMYQNQQRLLARLQKHGFRYELGYLLKDKDGVMHEKGVDVKMALDIQRTAFQNSCDRIILVSSDTDLIPAINETQTMGKTVEYIGFSHQRSLALLATCEEARLLRKDDLLPFIQTK